MNRNTRQSSCTIFLILSHLHQICHLCPCYRQLHSFAVIDHLNRQHGTIYLWPLLFINLCIAIRWSSEFTLSGYFLINIWCNWFHTFKLIKPVKVQLSVGTQRSIILPAHWLPLRQTCQGFHCLSSILHSKIYAFFLFLELHLSVWNCMFVRSASSANLIPQHAPWSTK